MIDDPMHVAVLTVQDLVHPVHHLDIRIAAHLAEDRRPLHGLITQFVQFPEKGYPADFGHKITFPI